MEQGFNEFFSIIRSTAPAGVLAFGSTFWHILRETGPFLVFGLFIAGVLHVLVPIRLILWALGGGGLSGAIRGALLGFPLPLCSCSVLPTAFVLRRQGASLSSVSAFAISTPETSVDAIAMTAALLPMAFLGLRPIASVLLAVFVGVLVEAFSSRPSEKLRSHLVEFSRAFEAKKKTAEVEEVCRVCGLNATDNHRHGFFHKIKATFSYAFVTFFEDMAVWLVLGLLFAAFFEVVLPEDFFKVYAMNPNFQILVAILFGIPIYSCATATTPLVAALLIKGLSPGAGLALLLTGPATNIGNILVMKRELGAKTTTLFYFFLISICFGFGVLTNFAWPYLETFPFGEHLTKLSSESLGGAHFIPAELEIGCAWFIVLMLAKMVYSRLVSSGDHDHHGHDH
ncbi:MAG: permease [Bacteriovoracia bacterium]